MRVDLNADVGEHAVLGQKTVSRGLSEEYDPDRALMPWVTSASIACGFHAGDPGSMRAAIALAREHGVAVGAHPSLEDREGFGRRELAVSPSEVEDLVIYQIGALAALAAAQGVRIRHVKAHGALYNMAARDAALANAIAAAVAAVDPSLVLFGLAGSELISAGARAGLRTASEVFADRAYQRTGALVPRGEHGAVLHDPDLVVGRAVAMVRDGTVTARDGSPVSLRADTICVHGDTPDAAVLARRIREALEREGIEVAAIGTAPGGGPDG